MNPARSTSSPRSRKKVVLGLFAVVPALALIAACGSSTEAASSGDSAIKFPAGTQAGVKASGTPVKIGIVNPEGGPAISHPESREAAEAAIKYANDNLGGIGGHPIEAVICKSMEDAASVRDCGNQMVEAKVAAVQSTTTGNGDSMAPIITKAGIPYFSASGSSASELTSPNSYMWTGGFPGTMIAMAKYSAEKGYKDVTIFVTNVPSAVGGTTSLGVPAFEAAGVTLKVVPIPLGLPDATPQVSAGLKGKPGGFIVVGDGTMCTSVLKAAQTLGTTADKIIIQPCMDISTVKAVGAGMEEAHVFTQSDLVGTDDETLLYHAIMAKYSPKTEPDGYAAVGYQGMMSMIRATKDITGDPTNESIIAAIEAAKDVPLPLAPGGTFTCDKKALQGLTAVCSVGTLVGTVKDGKTTDLKLVK